MDIFDLGYHHHHESTFQIHRPNGTDNWLLLMFLSPAILHTENEAMHLPRNSFILYTPGTPQHYGAANVPYTDDWLHFMPDQETISLIKELGIPMNQPVTVSDLQGTSNCLKQMCFEHDSNHTHRQQVSESYFRIMLYGLHEQIHQNAADSFVNETTHIAHLLWFRQSIFRSPEQEWNASEIAAQMHISSSRLQHLYTETFGSTLKQDVISSRIRLACHLLENTTMTFEEIAERCGYAGASHFNKLFTKIVGTTPKRYRKRTLKSA